MRINRLQFPADNGRKNLLQPTNGASLMREATCRRFTTHRSPLSTKTIPRCRGAFLPAYVKPAELIAEHAIVPALNSRQFAFVVDSLLAFEKTSWAADHLQFGSMSIPP
jgi:hypothetical protein